MITYELVRSRRKTLAIEVRDTAVVVKAPLKLNLAQIEAFFLKNQKWIALKLQQNQAKRIRFESVLTYDAFLLNGQIFPPSIQKNKDFQFSNGNFTIPQKYADAFAMHEINFHKKIERHYRKIYVPILEERLNELSEEYKLPFNSFKPINAKTKWGTCDIYNNICLNWRLCLIHKELADYVMIHELCHTYYHNHSWDFWQFVQKFDPKYKLHKQQLKDFSVIIQNLFRY